MQNHVLRIMIFRLKNYVYLIIPSLLFFVPFFIIKFSSTFTNEDRVFFIKTAFIIFGVILELSHFSSINKIMAMFSVSRKVIYISSFINNIFFSIIYSIPLLIYSIYSSEMNLQKIFALIVSFLSVFLTMIIFNHLNLYLTKSETTRTKRLILLSFFIALYAISVYLIPYIIEKYIAENAAIYISFNLLFITIIFVICNWRLFRTQEFSF